MKRLLFLILFLYPLHSWGQVPLASFIAPSTVCRQETIDLKNNSLQADSYEWDFCANDFATLKSTVSLGIVNGLIAGEGFKLIEDNNQWYGFATSRDNNKLFRFDYGNSPENTPAIIDLGNPGGLLHFPEGLDLLKANGSWYAFIGTLDFVTASMGIIRIDFGNSLTSTPLATNLGNFGLNSRIRNVGVVQQGSDLILILVSYNSDGVSAGTGGTLIRINYGNSFTNPIGAGNIFDAGFITGTNLPIGLNILKKNGNWIAHVSSKLTSNIIQLNFGSDILTAPVVEGSYSFSGLSSPINMKVLQEGNQYFAVVSNESQAFTVINLKDLNPVSVPVEVVTTGLPGLGGIDATRWMGKNVVWGMGNATNELRKIIFESNCGASITYSTNVTPVISYTTNGTKSIELRAHQNSTALTSIFSTSITTSSLISPDIAFTTDGVVCTSSPVTFISSSVVGSIVSYQWNFGDTGTSIAVNPSHVFTSAAVYDVKLLVNASNGCSNSIMQSISQFNQPTVDFLLPATTPICTNQIYSFTNVSVFDPSSNPTWEWRVDGSLISSSQTLLQSFAATSLAQVVRLKAILPGCSSEQIKNIPAVMVGPLVNFTSGIACQNTPLNFTNLSTGTISSYLWTFGDGNTSSSMSAINTYATFGTVNVSLQATNAVGCQNTITKPLIIYSKPLVDFSIGLPPFSCAGSPAQFTDGTPPPPDSNLSSWVWSFGDAANGSANSKNPTYTYPISNTYNVSLSAGTNFGCTAIIQKSVTIAPAPVAAFTNLPACTNQSTLFTDASTGNIKSRLWQIQASTFTSPTPQFTFSAAGSFPVSLTVTAINNCVSQINKNIIVPVVPTLDFSVQAPCTNSSTTFTEISSAADPSVSQSWAFGSLANGTGNPAQFSFPTPANYSIRLNSTRQSGCVYSVSKNISIINAPISDFSPSVDAGAAPLLVSFTNNSVLGNSYLWNFGDSNNTTSIIENPTFLFTELGNYSVRLMATNLLGCSSQASKIIRVVIPVIDVQLSDFYFFKDGTGALQPVVTILNKSNVSITDPTIVVEVGAGVKKKVIGTIKPNEELTQMLDFQIVPQALQYVCAEVLVAGDIDLFQNRKCLSLNGEEVIFSPYPNPAQSELYMDWISLEGSPVSIQIVNSSGSISFQQTVTSVGPGINRLLINTSNLALGIYYIRFSDNKAAKAFSFVIAGK